VADPGSTPGSGGQRRVRIFESYGRGDTSELADRLFQDMDARGFDVFLDREAEALHGGAAWEKKVHEALSNSEAVIAIVSPHAVREASPSGDSLASVCLDEIAFARYSKPPRPIVPVMAIACEPPWTLYRLEFIDMQGWEQSEERYQQALEQLLDAIELAKQGKQALRGFVLKLEPDEYLAAFPDDKRQNFTGRKWLFAEIERWRDTTDEPTLVITGDPAPASRRSSQSSCIEIRAARWSLTTAASRAYRRAAARGNSYATSLRCSPRSCRHTRRRSSAGERWRRCATPRPTRSARLRAASSDR
jgi:TIR domain-containing protein